MLEMASESADAAASRLLRAQQLLEPYLAEAPLAPSHDHSRHAVSTMLQACRKPSVYLQISQLQQLSQLASES